MKVNPKVSYAGLGVWQIHSIRWDDDFKTTGKDWTTTIVCDGIEAVWDWIAHDRNDLRMEIRSIQHLAHACAIIPREI